MSTAARRWLLLFVVLAAVGGVSAVAVGATFPDASPSGAATSTPSAAPTSAVVAAEGSAAPSSTAGQDPRATSTEVVETAPPDDVATDEPVVAEDGEAAVQIGYADVSPDGSVVEVNAFVSDRVEEGGSCALTLSRGERTHDVTTPAFADASTTMCEPLTVPTADLAPGEWEAVVTYTSADARGSSAAFEVTIP